MNNKISRKVISCILAVVMLFSITATAFAAEDKYNGNPVIVINGIDHSKEYFSQQMQDIDTYETYCKQHPDFRNNYAVIASEHIKKTYAELLEKGEWRR